VSKKLRCLLSNIHAVWNYRKRNVILSNLPTLLWIEPTNVCNLRCIMCPNKQIPKEKLGYMEWDVYKKIIDEARTFACSAYLLIAGESLLHKDIYRMIRYARENGIRPLLNTNGTTLVHEENIQRLLNAEPQHITFAFDGYDKETYEKIRVGARYEKTIEGIVNFLKAKKALGRKKPFVAITTLLVGIEEYGNVEKARDEFHQIFAGLPVDEFIEKTPNTWGGTFKETTEFYHHEPGKDFYPCSHLWSTMSIRWDGTVLPCCFDFFNTYTLGNVKERSLRQIWNDEPMRQLRKSMLDGTYTDVNPLCEQCVILTLDPILGLPAGMRAAFADSVTNLLGIGLEKYLIKLAKWVQPSFSLDIR